MTKKNSLLHLNVPDVIPYYKPRKKRLPYKRLTLVLWVIGVLGLMMLGVISLSFNSYVTLGVEPSVGGKAGVNVNVPLITSHMFEGEVVVGVKTPTTTTSTSTTMKYKSIPLEEVMPTTTTTTTLEYHNYSIDDGVSYILNTDPDWLGPCGGR